MPPRSRSRSPRRHTRDERERKEDTHKHHHHRHHDTHKRKRSPSPALPPRPVVLPFKARDLSKSDLNDYRPMFASYLDIQKGMYIEDLPEDEVKGRWKSFMKKWNRGELAEGWYDPITKQKAVDSAAQSAQDMASSRSRQSADQGRPSNHASDDDDADDYGPVLPSALTRAGPFAATFSDLALRKEQEQEDRQATIEDLRHDRKVDRRLQKDRLDELAPRAEAGTRERQIEKKADLAASNRAFRDARSGGDGLADVGESDLMGSGGGADEVRRMRKEEERKKNERELRREEIMRARAVEREERMQVVREKEAKTMEMLKAIAKERFG